MRLLHEKFFKNQMKLVVKELFQNIICKQSFKTIITNFSYNFNVVIIFCDLLELILLEIIIINLKKYFFSEQNHFSVSKFCYSHSA